VRVLLELPNVPAVIAAAVEGLCAANAVILSVRPDMPDLYESGVRYRAEDRERWTHCLDVLRRGYGDCEDLAAWRCAELRVREAEPARCVVKRTGRRTLHVLVRRADGRIEDPSRLLGMGATQ